MGVYYFRILLCTPDLAGGATNAVSALPYVPFAGWVQWAEVQPVKHSSIVLP